MKKISILTILLLIASGIFTQNVAFCASEPRQKGFGHRNQSQGFEVIFQIAELKISPAETKATPTPAPTPTSLPSGRVIGHLFEDTNGNGMQDSGEPNLTNVKVIITDNLDNTQTVTTDSDGNYSATVPAGNTTVDVDEKTLPADHIQTAGSDPTTVSVLAGEKGDAGNDGYQPQGIITGHLFEDTNGNGVQDNGEPNLADATVVIIDSLGHKQTVTTGKNGNYKVIVPAGSTAADVDETTLPADYIQTAGTDPTTVTVLAGDKRDAGNNGYQPKSTITGHLFEDTNGNSVQDNGEPNLPNVAVVVTNGIGKTQTITTDKDGNYRATVQAGNTTADVDETTLPAGLVQTAGSDPTTVNISAGDAGNAGNDGYQPQGTMSGHLFVDTNGNGVQDTSEPNLANVVLLITDRFGDIQTVTTDSAGNYSTIVPAGDTTADVDETTLPAGYTQIDGAEPITLTVLAGATTSAGNNGYRPQGMVIGHLFKDTNGNGLQDSDEPNLETVDTIITDSLGKTQTVTTNADGNYQATVPAGSTTINVDDTTLPEGSVQTAGSNPTIINVLAGSTTSAGNDGYQPQGTVIGHLFEDSNGSGIQDSEEPDLVNVDVIITDKLNNTQTVTTDTNGNYRTAVPPGSTTINVDDTTLPKGSVQTAGSDPSTLTVLVGSIISAGEDGYQPQGIITGHLFEDTNGNNKQDSGESNLTNVNISITDHLGKTQMVTTDANGDYSAVIPAGDTTVNIDETDLPEGSRQTTGSDPNTITVLAGSTTSAGEDAYQPQGTVIGHLFEDTNGNGVQETDEPNLANIEVIITDRSGKRQIVTTNGDGNYRTAILAGDTTVHVNETTLPAGLLQTAGSNPTAVNVPAGSTTNAGEDGYQPQGSITGHLFEDTNGNGLQDSGESNLTNVEVVIIDSFNKIQTLKSDRNGSYSAIVPAGDTTVNVNETTLPAGSRQTTGSDPTTVNVPTGSTTNAGEEGYQMQATITGHLFEDINSNSLQDSGEPNLTDVEVIITDSLGKTQTAKTGTDGNYIATVPAGSTTADVKEKTLPGEYIQTTGDDPTTVTIPAGGTGDAGNNGYQLQGTITGHLFEDTNGNGVQDSGEPHLKNVEVVITDSLGKTQTITTSSDGNYRAVVPVGNTTVNIDKKTLPAGLVQTAGSDPSTVNVPAGGSVNAGNDGYQPQGTVIGHVFKDTNGNGVQDTNEPNLANIDILVTDSLGDMQTVTTNADGKYSATVPMGKTTTKVKERALPAGFVQTAGTEPTTVTVTAGVISDAGDDGYQPQGTVIGHLFEDTSGNGLQDADETNLRDIDVVITDAFGNTQTIRTDSNGGYSATVPAGSTITDMDETTLPAGYVQTAGNDPTTVTVRADSTITAGNDGYQPQGQVTGHLFEDTNGNNVRDTGEPALTDVEAVITDSLGNPQTVTTDTNGKYSAVVPAGDTTVKVNESTLPLGLIQTAGSDPVTVTVLAGSAIRIEENGYQLQGTVIGHLFEDTNGNGIQDTDEPNLPDMKLVITDNLGNTYTVTTDMKGKYNAIVPAGDITVTVDETMLPAGYTQIVGTDPTTVTVPAGGIGNAGNDGYQPQGTVAGHLFEDTNGNGAQDMGEPNLTNVDILITDRLGNTQTVRTDSGGSYSAIVPAGDTTTKVNETILLADYVQMAGSDPTTINVPAGSTISAGEDGYQPQGTITGHLFEDTNGNGGQENGEPHLTNVEVVITDSHGKKQTVTTDSDGNYSAIVPTGITSTDVVETMLPAGFVQTTGSDPTTVTISTGSLVSAGNDGYQPQGEVIGHLFADTNGNGKQDSGESNLADVKIMIADSLDKTWIVTTDRDGNYSLTVPAGEATIKVDETTLPAGYTQAAGTDPTTVTVPTGGAGNAGNDGYQTQGTVTGHLFEDTNGNGVQDSGEPNLANIKVVITDNLDNTQTILTDTEGNYSVTVTAGDTMVNVDETTLAIGSTPTAGADPTVITVPGGGTGDAGNDGYQPQGILTGHLFEDTNGNSKQDSDEPELANVDVVITDRLGNTQTVTTDTTGTYNATVPTGKTTVNVDETTLPGGLVQTAGSDPTTVTVLAGSTAGAGDDGYQPQGFITGHLFEDTNGNGTQNSGEPNLTNVEVAITDNLGNMQMVTTDANGNYSTMVPTGETTINIDETTLTAGSRQTAGSDPNTISVLAGRTTNAGEDGYQQQGRLTGHLFEDTNSNGAQDPEEPNLANVEVVITDRLGRRQTIMTDSDGNYSTVILAGDITAHVNEATLPGGLIQTAGSDPATVNVLAGTTTSADDNGYQPQGIITGHLFEDTNGNGGQDADEPDLSNIDVVITDSLGNIRTITTDPGGNYSGNVPVGVTSTNVDETTLPAGLVQTAGSDPTTVNVLPGSTNSAGNDGYQPRGAVTGHLFKDINGNRAQDADEPDLANVDVVITDSLSNMHTVTTDTGGNYSAIVPAGRTTVNVDDTTLPEGSVQTAGSDPTTVKVLVDSTASVGENGYQPQGILTGHLFADTNGNGIRNSDEPELADVNVVITDSFGNTQMVMTDANGNYHARVPAGNTTINVDETTIPTGSGQTAGSDPNTITVLAGRDNNAGEDGYQPQGTVTGHLFEDTNGNGAQDPGEPHLVNVEVVITDSLGKTQTIPTDTKGNYSASVPAGDTTVNVNETTLAAGLVQTAGSDPITINVPAGSITATAEDGYQSQGIISGHLFVDTNGNGVQDIEELNLADVEVIITDTLHNTRKVTTDSDGNYRAVIPAGDTTADVNEMTLPAGFGQTAGRDPITVNVPAASKTATARGGYQPQGTVTGHLFEDTNGNGVQDSGESDLAYVDILITDSLRNTRTIMTDENGNYSAVVPAGDTTINVDEITLSVGLVQTAGSDPATVNVPAGSMTSADENGYQSQGVLTGHLFEDTNGNGLQDTDEPNLVNVNVIITDRFGKIQAVTSVAGGNYRIIVPTGATTVNVDETTLPPGAVQTAGSDPTTVNVRADSANSAGEDGYQPHSLVTGHLFEDINGNGNQDPGEPNLAGVEVVITDSLGNAQRISTDLEGDYKAIVSAGSTTVNVDEMTLPAGSVQTAGSNPTSVTGLVGSIIDAGYDGYQPRNASISGIIWNDINRNGIQDEGEVVIGGVTIDLVDSAGNVIATVMTLSDGSYEFVRLPTGNYMVIVSDTNDVLAGQGLADITGPLSVILTASIEYDTANFVTQPKPVLKPGEPEAAETAEAPIATPVIPQEPCVVVPAELEKPWFMTDIAMYAASEMVMTNPSSLSPTGIRGFGTEISRFSGQNITTVMTNAGIGVHLKYAPLILEGAKARDISPEQYLTKLLQEFAQQSNLNAVPRNISPVFIEYAQGDPRYTMSVNLNDWSTFVWDSQSFDTGLIPSAYGQSLLRQVLLMKEFLATNHGKDGRPDVSGEFLGVDAGKGFLGILAAEEVVNKLWFMKEYLLSQTETPGEDRSPYFPYQLTVDPESLVSDSPDIRIVDDQSRLFDQLSLLWGLSELMLLTDPEAPAHYHQVFRQEILAPGVEFQKLDNTVTLSEVSAASIHALAQHLADIVFTTIMKFHYLPEEQTLVDTVLNVRQEPFSDAIVSTAYVGLSLPALGRYYEVMRHDPERQEQILNLIRIAADYLVDQAYDTRDGGFFETMFLDPETHNSQPSTSKTLTAQMAGIRGLLAAYKVTREQRYRSRAFEAYKYTEEFLRENEIGVYKDRVRRSGYKYTPLSVGTVIGALRELIYQAEDPQLIIQLQDRMRTFVKRIVKHAGLQLSEVITGKDREFLIPPDRGSVIRPAESFESPFGLAPVLGTEISLDKKAIAAIHAKRSTEACEQARNAFRSIHYSTDIGMYAASEFALTYERLSENGPQKPQATKLDSRSRQSNAELLDPWSVKVIGATAGDLSDENLNHIQGQSSLGIPLKYGPALKQRSEPLEALLKRYADLAGLKEIPESLAPIFIEFEGGVPEIEDSENTGSWIDSGMDKSLIPSALGQALVHQVLWMKHVLSARHEADNRPGETGYIGRSASEGFLGLLVAEAVANKLAFLKETMLVPLGSSTPSGAYFPHRFEVTFENDEPKAYTLEDASSHLLDQVSLLWGLSECKRLQDRLKAELQTDEIAKELVGIILDNLETLHWNADHGTLYNVNAVDGRLKAEPQTISTHLAGMAIIALESVYKNFPEEPAFQETAKRLLLRQSAFLLRHLFRRDGAVYNGAYPGNEVQPLRGVSTLLAQTAAIRSFLIAYRVSGDEAYLEAAKRSFEFLDKTFWDDRLQVYKSAISGREYHYTPLNVGMTLGALRELILVGETEYLEKMIPHLSKFFELVVQRLGLQLPGQQDFLATFEGKSKILAPVLVSDLEIPTLASQTDTDIP